MQPVALALFWHQHQPYYPDDVSGENLMPWVRLHGTKDYYGMAMHIKDVPEFRCTINLVPSLLRQIERYTEHGASDRHLDVSRVSAEDISHADLQYLLDNFFMANVDGMIRRYPRYFELYLKRGIGIDTAERAAPRFSVRDIRDLQVWSNLTWIHELAFESDPDLVAFRKKGRHWTESEKHWLLDRQLEILKQIIPLHRELQQGGQIELTTTPYYHPILPLLWDKRAAREAMPGCALPNNLESYAEDAEEQIRRGVEYHTQLFGQRPRGMWPSEGSVSQAILKAISSHGIEWIATDEEILSASTNGWVSRDSQGHLRHPEMLYRPWRLDAGRDDLQIIFRDHAMSDLIGFHYQRSDPQHAANDLLTRVESIGRAVETHNGGRPALVPIILDGENCWEYYPDGGVSFLRTLYRSVASSSQIHGVRVGEHLKEYPATDRISQLFAGSWISHNFAIWIGHHEDNTAWDALHETRVFFRRAAESGQHSEETLERALNELFIAEGSDWFWWFGDDHSSDQDELFDHLFRRHLQNVYTLLGESPPPRLSEPISSAGNREIHTQPTGFLPVKVDGRRTYFEWICAGRYVAGSERGTMTQVTAGLVEELYFGFDRGHLFIRLDTAHGMDEDFGGVSAMRVRFQRPENLELEISDWKGDRATCRLLRDGVAVPSAQCEAAVQQIVEIKMPLADLGLVSGDPVQFSIELTAGSHSIERVPQEGFIDCQVPSEDFESIMWQA